MKKLMSTLCLSLVFISISAHADLSSSKSNGVLTISGNIGSQGVKIKRYADAGKCYTMGYFGDETFRLLTYRDAGRFIVRGDIPNEVQSILEGFGLGVYDCSR